MDNLVYHYTSLEALEGIIKKDKIVLWATRYGHLNDKFEKIWAANNIKTIIKKDLEGTGHSFDIIEKLLDRHPYTISLCDIPDYRNMWRLYCNDGLGVCICLDSCLLNEIAQYNRLNDPETKQDYFEHIYYCSRKKVSEAISFWRNTGIFNTNANEPEDNLYAMSSFIKNDEFDVENEVRYARIRDNSCVKIKADKPENGVAEECTKGVKYRIRNQKEVVPYIEIDFPSNVIKKIVIGYAYDNKEEVVNYVKQILSKNSELKNIDVTNSTLNDE